MSVHTDTGPCYNDCCGASESDSDSDKLDQILNLTLAMFEDIEAIKEKVNEVVPEVKPVLDQLTSSPMFRMIAGGGKKNRV